MIIKPSSSTFRHRFTGLALLSALLMLTGCDLLGIGDDEEATQPSATVSSVFIIPDFIEDADGNPAKQASAPLFEKRAHQPILAPDGHHVTLAEFSTPRGTATMTCVDGGTRVAFEAEGLIPNGTYSAFVFK